jgi:hypothetical protein
MDKKKIIKNAVDKYTRKTAIPGFKPLSKANPTIPSYSSMGIMPPVNVPVNNIPTPTFKEPQKVGVLKNFRQTGSKVKLIKNVK